MSSESATLPSEGLVYLNIWLLLNKRNMDSHLYFKEMRLNLEVKREGKEGEDEQSKSLPAETV